MVTGAGRGIGRATAVALTRAGASVAVTDLTQTLCADTLAEIAGFGGSAAGWALDVSSRDAIRAVIPAIAAQFGRLDVVINNAGIAPVSDIHDDAGFEAAWDRAISVNLTAHQRVIRAALPHLRQSPAGRIVNIASIEGLGASRGQLIYTVTKSAVVGLTRAFAVELGRDGITCNCICPGPVDTDMTSFLSPEDKATFARRQTALGRYAQPEEIAVAVVALCQPGASYTTGAIIPVDGGFMARNG